MTTLSQVGARWALLGFVTLGAIAACGSSDGKKAPTNYRDGDDDDDGGTDGNNGNSDGAGAGGTGDGSSTDGGMAAGGRETMSGGVANGGVGDDGAGRDGGGATGEAGTAGETGGGVDGPLGSPVDGDDGRASSGGPLTFQVTAAQSPAVVGQRVLYTVTIGNASDLAVAGVSVLLRVPEGLQFHYTRDASPSTSCGAVTCAPKAEATWAVGTLAPRSSYTILVNALVMNTVGNGGFVDPLFRIKATGLDQVDVTKTTPVQTAPPAELTLTADADPVVAGQEIELKLDVGQIGATSLAAGRLELELPGGLLTREISDGGTVTNGKVVWDVGSVSVGSTLRRSVTAKVHSKLVSGDVLNPRASFTYTGGLDVDNVAQVPLSVVPEKPPLSLTVVEQNSPVTPTGQLLYQVTVANTGLRAIDDLSLGMLMPPELSFHYTQDATPATSCGAVTCASAAQASWTLASLPAGTSETFTINASAVANAAGDGTLVSTPFWLRAAGVNPLNRLKTVPVYSKPAGQLVLGTAVSPVTPGQTFTYDLDVGQVGAAALNATTLTVQLPPDVSVGAISDGGTSAEGVVTWDLGKVAVAATAHRSVDVTVGADVVPGAALLARARLTYTGGAELDAESELAVAVVAEPLPLSVKVEATPADAAVIGASHLYKTTIKNEAARAVDDLALRLRVPGFSFHYTTNADPDTSCGAVTCSLGSVATWSLGSLNAGASSVVTVNPKVDATLTAGSLLTFRQRLTATDLGGTIFLQKTLPTKSP